MTTPAAEIKTAEKAPAPEVVVTGPTALALPAAPSVEWLKKTLNPGQIKTLCATVAPHDTPEDVLAAFFWSARRRGLDPFLKQVHLVKRRRRVQRDDGSWGWEDYWVHQTGIDGFRLVSSRVKIESGKHADELALDGVKRGCLYDDKGQLIGAWAEVYRKDWSMPARAEVDFDEYCPRNDKGQPTGLWVRMPKGQIQKCAEAACHRMAFPEDLGDTYEHAELDAAEHLQRINQEETEPLSSATAPPVAPSGDGRTVEVVDAEIVREGNGQGLFSGFGEPAPPMVADLRASIDKARAGFQPPPKPQQWVVICQHFCQADDHAKVAEPALLADLLNWLRDLSGPAGEAKSKALATLQEIAGKAKKAGTK